MTLPNELRAWALRHHVSVEAVAELAALLTAGALPETSSETSSESRVQSEVRLAAAAAGMTLWRNNVGVLKNPNGVPVRFGLANDSPALNKRLKSGDLIGWKALEITRAHVGAKVAQFVSLEVKSAGWTYSGTDREQAQGRWAALVSASGGVGRMVNSAEGLA